MVKGRIGSILLVALIIVSFTTIPIPSTAETALNYKIFANKKYDLTPIGVFHEYLIGFKASNIGTEIVAINMYTDKEVFLGLAETYGLDTTNVKFWKTEDYFMLTDGTLVIVWDKNLYQVGRYAQDNLKGVSMAPTNYLLAWSTDVVSVFKAPGFTYGKQYDLWSVLYNYMKSAKIKPEELLEVSGYNPSEIKDELMNEILNTVRAENGTIIKGPTINITYDLEAKTPTEARAKFIVDVISATYVNETLYVAANVELNILAEAMATYTVPEDNATVIKTAEVSRTYSVKAGFLIYIDDNTTTVKEIYANIEAGATSSMMAYVYVPLITENQAPRILAIVSETGDIIKVPVYTKSVVTEVWVVDDYEFVKTDSNVLLMYKEDNFIGSIVVKTLSDIGITSDGNIYLVYTNDAGALELGCIETYSGRYEKYVIETSLNPIGAYLGNNNSLLFLAGKTPEDTTEVLIGTSKPLATLEVNFVDIYGNPVTTIIDGNIEIIYGDLNISLDSVSNPLVVIAPVQSFIHVRVEVPYGVSEFTYALTEAKTYHYVATITYPLTPGLPEVSNVSVPFYNPFFREYVLIKDTETMKYELPGASAIDAYGTFLALIRAQNNETTTSTLDLYRVDGVRIYSKTLPELITEIKFYYPYLVAKGENSIYVLDALTGAIKGTLTLPANGYDIDIDNEYLSAWTDNTIAVLDLRRQTTVFMDMSNYGKVLVAPIVNGVVYAYVASKGGINIYMINPVTKGIIDILPWNGKEVIGFISDGRFHIVSYRAGGKNYMDVLSSSNGIVTINDGPAVWVKTLGKVVNIPSYSELVGNLFAAVITSNNGVGRIYVVGANHVLVGELRGMPSRKVRFAVSFFAEARIEGNATPVVVLRDYSGTPRLIIIPSVTPTYLAVSDNLIAYGDNSVIYLIPNPRILGKYKIILHIRDDQGQPLNATLTLKEFGISLKAENGEFETYLSIPGVYHIDVTAPYFKTKTVTLSVSDTSPVAEVTVRLEPQFFKLTINVVTPAGEPVKEGIVKITGTTLPFESELNLSVKNTIDLRPGTYNIKYISDLYSSAEATVDITKDTKITLTVNRTFIRLQIRTVDETGAPIPNASITIESDKLPIPIKLSTDENGLAETTIPYGITFNVTATAEGYEKAVLSNLTAKEDLEAEPLTIHLRTIKGSITIILQDEEGHTESALVTVRDAYGNIIQTIPVTGSITIDVDLGTYTIEGTTDDGRTASTTVTVTQETPVATATLIFPKKQPPFYVQIFPYLLGVVLAATAAVIVYRRFIRKPKPKKVA